MRFIEINEDIYINVDNIEGFSEVTDKVDDEECDTYTIIRMTSRDRYKSPLPPYKIAKMIRSCGGHVEEMHCY